MTITARTTTGQVQGTNQEGVATFRCIPYAAATSGMLRFLPPQPRAPWSGTLDCTAFTGKAPQAGLAPVPIPELANFSGPADPSPETEDCLTVNIWTPAADSARRPVMVWFHGGAFSYGNANAPRLTGSRLASKHDVVVVNVNQRLNIFGHLDLSELGGDLYRQSGNAGTLDMLAALEWVRDNIANFGGDPGNVTIFGESGGGGKVSVLLAMPLAQGLFHKAIIQSGAVVQLRTPERARTLTALVLQHLGINTIQALQEVPVDSLLAAVAPANKALGPSSAPLFDRYPFGPTNDGDLVCLDAPASDIPLIIGDMKDETANFLAPVPAVWNRTLTDAELADRVAAIAGSHTGRVLQQYQGYPNAAERLIAITTDCNFRIRSLVLAQRRAAQNKAPVWMYSFEWETPVLGGRLKAPHAMDVPFCFNTLDLTNATGGDPAAQELSDTMAAVWTSFARTGRPDHSAIPAWPVYDSATRATLILDDPCRIENDPRAGGRQLWQDITGTTV